MSNSELETAQQSQEKFQFYATALVFTMLGLSVQTASFDGSVASKIFEIFGWLCLLVSGFSALSHLEWSPVLRVKMVKRDELSDKSDKLVQHRDRGVSEVNLLQHGKTVPIEERIDEYKLYIEKLDGLIESLDRKAEIKYQVFKWSFALGIISIVSARALDPLVSIIKELCA